MNEIIDKLDFVKINNILRSWNENINQKQRDSRNNHISKDLLSK